MLAEFSNCIWDIGTTDNSSYIAEQETFQLNETAMASKAPWEMKPEEVEKQMAGPNEYEDCLACRITGRRTQTITPRLLLLMVHIDRIRGVYGTRGV